jgi:hypothetical protein
VDLDDRPEILDAHLGKAAVAQDPGIVDQDVDPAPALLRGRDHRFDLLRIGDAGAVRDSLAARRLDLLDHLAGRVGAAGAVARAAEVVHHHSGAAPGKL